MRFRAEVSVGNGDGVFDAAYDFGEGSGAEAAVAGTSEQIGAAVTRYLSSLSPEDCQKMGHSMPRFFVQLVITPEPIDEPEAG